MLIKLNKFGDMLISRPAGREAFLAMKAYTIKGIPADEELILDFSGVKVLAPSWADEVITNLAKKYKIKVKNTSNSSVKMTLKILTQYSNLVLD